MKFGAKSVMTDPRCGFEDEKHLSISLWHRLETSPTKGNDIFMSGDWGAILQKGSPVWQAVRIAFHEAVNYRGQEGMVNLYKEKGIYNMYVKVNDDDCPPDLCPQDEVEMQADGGGDGSAGDFPRQTSKS